MLDISNHISVGGCIGDCKKCSRLSSCIYLLESQYEETKYGKLRYGYPEELVDVEILMDYVANDESYVVIRFDDRVFFDIPYDDIIIMDDDNAK